MSFKIVQTKEPGRKLPSLTIVPSAWERSGTLFWPPTAKKGLLPKLVRDGNSRPEKNWVPQPCVNKRHTFLSYEAAELELTAMEQKSDSEAAEENEEFLPRKRITTQKRTEIGRIVQANFNNVAEECAKKVTNEETHQPTKHNIPQYTIISKTGPKMILPQDSKRHVRQERVENVQTIMVVNQDSPQPSGSQQIRVLPSQIYPLDENTESVFDSNSQMDTEENEELIYELEQSSENGQIKLCLDNQNNIMQNQSSLLENQMRIIEQLANQETMLQLICQHMSNATVTTSTCQVSDESSNITIPDPLPIDSVATLEKLEIDLRDESYMKQLIISKSQICGTSGKKNGLNCCYHLIDYFFQRTFLTHFSWSGGSRKEEGKMAFKIYKNVMKTFYKIISKADSAFSETECECFFKGVIKNARRRSELASCMEKRRASSGKKRPKNLTYKKVENNDTLIEEESNACGDPEDNEESEQAEETEQTEHSDQIEDAKQTQEDD